MSVGYGISMTYHMLFCRCKIHTVHLCDLELRDTRLCYMQLAAMVTVAVMTANQVQHKL